MKSFLCAVMSNPSAEHINGEMKSSNITSHFFAASKYQLQNITTSILKHYIS